MSKKTNKTSIFYRLRLWWNLRRGNWYYEWWGCLTCDKTGYTKRLVPPVRTFNLSDLLTSDYELAELPCLRCNGRGGERILLDQNGRLI